jgi:beta-1,2-mannobiose phosphorylase / 1,2-beta-oligomannan phosphorylase
MLNQPLLKPRTKLKWEAGGIFSPAVLKTEAGYSMYYRAFGSDRVSRIGYATSADGLKWQRHNEPLLVPHDTSEHWGMEDPRAVSIDGLTILTYTAANGHTVPDGWEWTTRIRFATSRDGRHFARLKPKMPELNNKDGVLFPRKIAGSYWLLHRPEPDIWIARSPDLEQWADHRRILAPIAKTWQDRRIGAGPPPIETPLGWLLFYHGVSSDLTYSMSAAILDRDDPTKVLYRTIYPLLLPVTDYEVRGVVPNVIFGTSVIDEGRHFHLYYGAADRVIAAAKINKVALLDALTNYPATTADPRPLPV